MKYQGRNIKVTKVIEIRKHPVNTKLYKHKPQNTV